MLASNKPIRIHCKAGSVSARLVFETRGLSGSPTVTFFSVHIHNVVAKKRDASTDLQRRLRRLHGCTLEHNVDFTGGDFNMGAFATVGNVLSDTEFSAPGNSFLWGLVALEEPNRECVGFLSHRAIASI